MWEHRGFERLLLVVSVDDSLFESFFLLTFQRHSLLAAFVCIVIIIILFIQSPMPIVTLQQSTLST